MKPDAVRNGKAMWAKIRAVQSEARRYGRSMQDFKKLRAWQGARALTLEIHRVFAERRMPSYGWLKTQALRAAGSIPANLAEGCGKESPRELARYAEISVGSKSPFGLHPTDNHATGDLGRIWPAFRLAADRDRHGGHVGGGSVPIGLIRSAHGFLAQRSRT